jgi:enoyl-CoA hydratase
MTGQIEAGPTKEDQIEERTAPIAEQHLKVTSEGALVLVTLDRPRALNALTRAMRNGFGDVLTRASRDPNTYCVVVQSASPKAFSAGSDVREIVTTARADPGTARLMFAEEYARNWHCECFSKPTISLIDGVVMGGGVGISLYGTHRVAGEGYMFSMPETGIGLFPDVGTCHAFARMPGHIGAYLGLTGRTIGRADAFVLGLVTHCIAALQFDEIKALLSQAEPVDTLLDDRHAAPGEGELAAHHETIAHCFGAGTVEEIISRLRAVSGADKVWALAVASELLGRSPLSLKITLRHIREAVTLDLRETLHRDYRLGCHCLDAADFTEGVRAVLIDKDGAPKWNPARVEDVTPAMVEAYFAPRAEGEPILPTRVDMQAARA